MVVWCKYLYVGMISPRYLYCVSPFLYQRFTYNSFDLGYIY